MSSRQSPEFFQDRICLQLNPKTHPIRAIMAACYVLTDRCYVRLEGRAKTAVKVTLKPKQGPTRGNLRRLKSLFMDEVATQMLRWRIAEANQEFRRSVILQALKSAAPIGSPELSGQSSGNDLTQQERQDIGLLLENIDKK